jgi:hypothetical protein
MPTREQLEALRRAKNVEMYCWQAAHGTQLEQQARESFDLAFDKWREAVESTELATPTGGEIARDLPPSADLNRRTGRHVVHRSRDAWVV